MRKRTILIAGAVAFNLGVMVMAGQAAPNPHDNEAKKESVAATPEKAFTAPGPTTAPAFKFFKIDSAFTSQACMDHNGTVVTNRAGQQACQSKKFIPGAIELTSF